MFWSCCNKEGDDRVVAVNVVVTFYFGLVAAKKVTAELLSPFML
jgi:hypothetical protein